MPVPGPSRNGLARFKFLPCSVRSAAISCHKTSVKQIFFLLNPGKELIFLSMCKMFKVEILYKTVSVDRFYFS